MPPVSSMTPARVPVAVATGTALALGASLVAITPAAAAPVPTTFYVAPTGNDAGTGSDVDPFLTIQRAVDAALDGDTVSVAAGTYAGATTVAEDLSIVGHGSILPGVLNLSAGAEGASVTGFVFTNTQNQIGVTGLDGSAVATIAGNTFHIPTDSAEQRNSILIMTGKGLVIEDNEFIGTGVEPDSASVNIIGDVGGSVISDITVRDNVSDGYTNFFVAVGGGTGGITDIEVSGNDVSGTNGSAAVYLSENLSDLSITGNTFHDNNGGVRFTIHNQTSTVSYDEVGTGIEVSGNVFADNLRGIRVQAGTVDDDIDATGNVFVGNTQYAVLNDSAYEVDASGSNWSDSTPPSSGTDSVTGSGAVVVDPVATEPFFDEPADSSGAAANLIAGATAVTTGAETEVALGAGSADTWFAVWGYSATTFLGWARTDGSGELTVTWPQDVYDTHHLAFLRTDGTLAGFVATSGPASTAFTKAPVPGVSGTPQVGRTLTAITRTWDPSAAALGFQWKADGADIPSATGNQLVLTPALAGKKISVVVTGTLPSYTTTSRTSPQTPAVAKGALTGTVPIVSGSRTVGATLTAAPGTWGPVAVTFGYKWLRDGTVIAGATGASYVQTGADRNRRITVVVTGTATGYNALALTSAKPAKTGYRLLAKPSAIALTGTPAVGTRLSIASTGSWASGSTLTYVWRVGGVVVKNATKSSYTPLASDIGKTVVVTVSGTKPSYTATRISSPASAPVAAGTFTTTPAPVISAAKVGYPATVSIASWTASPTSFAYQWQLDGSDVPGATKPTFTPPADSIGATLTVEITGARAGFTPVTVESTGKTVAIGAFSVTTKPKLSGTARVGRVLTATVSGWSPAAQYSYQWNLDGVAITGAIDNTYTVSSEDVGGRLTVTITGARAGFTSATEISNPTAVVTP